MALDQSNSSKLMWIIVAGLVTIVTLAVVFLWMSSKDPALSTANSPTKEAKVEVVPATSPNPTALPNDVSSSASETTAALDPVTDAHALVSERILKDEIPENATFAKEEVAKLDELQQQLDAQHASLEAQLSDADQLIALKEQQIKLLEQQLSAHN